MYAKLIIIKAWLRIALLDWLKAEMFYEVRNLFQYLYKNYGVAD